MLALLSGAKYFTVLDLKSGYWQVKVKEEDKKKTAFTVSHRGLFEFNCTPFGLVNAPEVFQSLMAECLTQFNHFAVAYLNDILSPPQKKPDMYSGWPEAFAAPTKNAETVAHLFIEEIYHRFGAVLQIIHNRGTEYVNEVFQKTTKYFKRQLGDN